MTDKELGALFEAFASYYWSIPIEFVFKKIAKWHDNVTTPQLKRVVLQCMENIFQYHCIFMEIDGQNAELVVEHLLAFDESEYDQFIDHRIPGEFYDCSENDLIHADDLRIKTPEARAIIDFGKTELGLDNEWALQLVDACALNQPYAVMQGNSWVMEVLNQEKYGKIRFQTIEQVKCFRELGNKLYQVMPNPILKGWRPCDIENTFVLMDHIPEKADDIPSFREEMYLESNIEVLRRLFELQLYERTSYESKIAKNIKKIGRNDPCPCGSGLKFKKCKCALYHSD
ncbi:MAG: SEC-C domain-containing protein [Eubacteriaceae bacterium]|nr:SEC-C domain-containing protein [Eubacteriaceae bacterium]